MVPAPLTIRECFGLSPLPVRLREALLTFRGDAFTPRSRFDASSLKILAPGLSLRMWLGLRPRDRRAPVYNFYSHAQPPPEEGWSVRVTQARDFRGGQATYDSHNGTDFALPPGTTIVAAAPGRVLRVSSEFNRGGLKVFLDHGGGLVTTSNHLGRSLVKPGDEVRRGQPIALSGMSGVDGLLLFPLSTPHIHFNVWLNGEPVDPFALPGEPSLWRGGDWPVPFDGGDPGEPFAPTRWSAEGVERAVEACRHEGARREILSYADPAERAMAALFQMNYYPTRFSSRPSLYEAHHERAPRLDLPLSRSDYDGVRYPARGAPRGGPQPPVRTRTPPSARG